MNACILAGGIGSRLRPLTCMRPKPMISLFDRPVLTYTLDNLNRIGVKRCFITLMYLPDAILSYFGDQYGDMELIYHIEESAQGNAGGILAFREALMEDDFLVVSGDVVFDYDLSEAIAAHRSSGNLLTLLAVQAKDPTSFGTLSLDPNGKVLTFTEKPSWENTCGGLINTGLYVLSPKVLSIIPNNSAFDFSKDLFPVLIREKKLGALVLHGYWQDIGTPEAYYTVMKDALDGSWKPSLPIQSAKPPRGAEVTHPFYLSPDAVVEEGCQIGPYAIIERYATICARSTVTHSYVNGKIEPGASVTGVIADKGSRIGANSIVLGGSILGEGSMIGSGCLIENDVHVWCHAVIEQGSHIISGSDIAGLSFRHRLCITQGHVHQIKLPDCLCLAYSMKEAGIHEVAVGYSPKDPLAAILANTFTSGFLASGGGVFFHDASFAACGAWIGSQLKVPFSLWFESDELMLFNAYGRLAFDQHPKFPIRSFSHNEDISPDFPHYLVGCDQLYKNSFLLDEKLTLRISSSDPRLVPTLKALGCLFPHDTENVIHAAADLYGIHLSLSDEKGYAFTPDEMVLLLILCSLLSGEKTLCIPDNAPQSAQKLAAEFGAELIRVQASNQPVPNYYDHALAALMLILNTMQRTGRSLSSLASSIPPCFTTAKCFRSPLGRINALNRFSELTHDLPRHEGHGIRVTVHDTSIILQASSTEDFLLLKTESNKAELAGELCDFFYRQLSKPNDIS